jgi:hypothetical protein
MILALRELLNYLQQILCIESEQEITELSIQIQDGLLLIIITKVGHRRDIYK